MLFEWFMERKKPTKEKLFSVLLLFTGSVLAVNMVNVSFNSDSYIGILWGLLGAFCFTLFIYTSGRVGTNVPATLKSTYMVLGALVITFIFFPPEFLVNGTLFEGLWIWGVILGVIGSYCHHYFSAYRCQKWERV
ncbi:hypothetical protein ACFOUV_15770 [Oceanobacillus longus]|uniref:EamA-like transporter family protein n=1 Tax=Oceanobacillus longus TaxID=930120 RepID=A0ABV8H364_9BACI